MRNAVSISATAILMALVACGPASTPTSATKGSSEPPPPVPWEVEASKFTDEQKTTFIKGISLAEGGDTPCGIVTYGRLSGEHEYDGIYRISCRKDHKDTDLEFTKAEVEKGIRPHDPFPQNWSYTLGSDEMTGKRTVFARASSTNTVNFAPPYSGPQKGELMVRTHPRFGTDVMISFERGQMLCSSYNGCSVLVKFDDKPPQSFSAAEPADYSTETLFIQNTSRFLNALGTAKKVIIEVPVYQHGNQSFRFDTEGFSRQRMSKMQNQ